MSRTGGLASGVTVDFTTADGTAIGRHRLRLWGTTPPSGTLTFAASQVTKTIKIPLLIEVGAQPTKSFSVILSNPGSGGTLGARTTATVNITRYAVVVPRGGTAAQARLTSGPKRRVNSAGSSLPARASAATVSGLSKSSPFSRIM